MVGRTEYQNVAGTRCATDFVELPSILMEHFLLSPTALSLFDLQCLHSPTEYSIDTHSQILLAAIDQVYHSPAMFEKFDSTAELAKLHDNIYVHETSFQTQFGYLFGYGAYYSYLFDRAIASRQILNRPLDRETGEKFEEEILRHRGGKDPWKMVNAFLGQSLPLEVWQP